MKVGRYEILKIIQNFTGMIVWNFELIYNLNVDYLCYYIHLLPNCIYAFFFTMLILIFYHKVPVKIFCSLLKGLFLNNYSSILILAVYKLCVCLKTSAYITAKIAKIHKSIAAILSSFYIGLTAFYIIFYNYLTAFAMPNNK